MNYTDCFSLKGKNLVIFGSGGILGPVFCDAYAQFGANIVMLDNAHQNCGLSKKHHVKTMLEDCDATNLTKFNSLLDKVESEFGNIDIYHYNVATKGKNLEDFLKHDENYLQSTWQDVISVNLEAAYFTAVEIAKRMKKTKHGSIIFTGSIYGLNAPDQRIYEGSFYNDFNISSPGVYSASKAGLIGVTRHLAALWGEDNIRVNCLVPGGVQSGQNETFINKYSARVPLARMANKEDLVGAAIYLASDASSYVTGQALSVDGGLNCW